MRFSCSGCVLVRPGAVAVGVREWTNLPRRGRWGFRRRYCCWLGSGMFCGGVLLPCYWLGGAGRDELER